MKSLSRRSERRPPPAGPGNRRTHAPRGGRPTQAKPPAAYRQRVSREPASQETFNAPEVWHPPTGDGAACRYVVQPAGRGYIHPVTVEDVRARIAELPQHLTRDLEVVQFSRMTRKRRLFPCYGMQWGQAVYLFPIEESLVEAYVTPPKPSQQIEAQMFGATWQHDGRFWTLTWTPESIRDFYLNNVLIHEIGHIHDTRNNNYRDRERYANWFAIEYGYKPTRR